MRTWNILYRGSLSSCNYSCGYCPFAKTSNTIEELQDDANALNRFVNWVERMHEYRIGILITPWGEGLIHKSYRLAMHKLSYMSHVYRVSIQTNLSFDINKLDGVNTKTFALWTTFHPSQTPLRRFVERCHKLDSLGIRYSVGVVGLKEHFGEIERLRACLKDNIYLWVNAFKDQPDYYTPKEIEFIEDIDPWFSLNLVRYPSVGKACEAGNTTFTVDSKGDVRRCHFIEQVIGNIYEEGISARLRPVLCSANACSCHIGYVHRPELGLYELFGDGVLERIPEGWGRAGRANGKIAEWLK